MKTKFNQIVFLIFLSVLVAACGTNKKDVEQEVSVNQGDITRPPEFVKRDQQAGEGNPDETISLEEWKKQQEK